MSATEEIADHKLDPNYAVICSFLEHFGKLVYTDTSHLSIHNLDLFLSAENVETDIGFIKLQLKLLRGIGYTGACGPDTLDKSLIKFSEDFSERDDKLIKELGYSKIPVAAKIRILKNLCEDQFEFNDRFNVKVNELLAEENNEDGLRHLPLGTDKQGRTYWYMMDTTGTMRLYRSLRNDFTGKESWSLLCSEADGLKDLINCLESYDEVPEEDPNLEKNDIVPADKQILQPEWMKITEEEVVEIMENTKHPSTKYYKVPKPRTSAQIEADESKHNLKHCFIKIPKADKDQAEQWKKKQAELKDMENPKSGSTEMPLDPDKENEAGENQEKSIKHEPVEDSNKDCKTEVLEEKADKVKTGSLECESSTETNIQNKCVSDSGNKDKGMDSPSDNTKLQEETSDAKGETENSVDSVTKEGVDDANLDTNSDVQKPHVKTVTDKSLPDGINAIGDAKSSEESNECSVDANVEMNTDKESKADNITPDPFADDIDMKETLMRISELSGSLTNDCSTQENEPLCNSSEKSLKVKNTVQSAQLDHSVSENEQGKHTEHKHVTDGTCAKSCATNEINSDSNAFDDAIKNLKTLEEIINQGNTLLSSNELKKDMSDNSQTLDKSMSDSKQPETMAKNVSNTRDYEGDKVEAENKDGTQDNSAHNKAEVEKKDLSANKQQMKTNKEHSFNETDCQPAKVCEKIVAVSELQKHNGKNTSGYSVVDEKVSMSVLQSPFGAKIDKDLKIELERIDEIFNRNKQEIENICKPVFDIFTKTKTQLLSSPHKIVKKDVALKRDIKKAEDLSGLYDVSLKHEVKEDKADSASLLNEIKLDTKVNLYTGKADNHLDSFPVKHEESKSSVGCEFMNNPSENTEEFMKMSASYIKIPVKKNPDMIIKVSKQDIEKAANKDTKKLTGETSDPGMIIKVSKQDIEKAANKDKKKLTGETSDPDMIIKVSKQDIEKAANKDKKKLTGETSDPDMIIKVSKQDIEKAANKDKKRLTGETSDPKSNVTSVTEHDYSSPKVHKLIVDGDEIEINQLSSDSDSDDPIDVTKPSNQTGTGKGNTSVKQLLSNGVKVIKRSSETPQPQHVQKDTLNVLRERINTNMELNSTGNGNVGKTVKLEPTAQTSSQAMPHKPNTKVIYLNPKPSTVKSLPQNNVKYVRLGPQNNTNSQTVSSVILQTLNQPVQHVHAMNPGGSKSNPIVLSTNPASGNVLGAAGSVLSSSPGHVLPGKTLYPSSSFIVRQTPSTLNSSLTSPPFASLLSNLSMRFPGSSIPTVQQPNSLPIRIQPGLSVTNQKQVIAQSPAYRYNVSQSDHKTTVSKGPDGRYYESKTGLPFQVPNNGRHVVLGFDNKFYDTKTGEVVNMKLKHDQSQLVPGTAFFLVPNSTSTTSSNKAIKPKLRALQPKQQTIPDTSKIKMVVQKTRRSRRSKKVIVESDSSDSEGLYEAGSDGEEYDYDTLSRRVREARMKPSQRPRKMPKFIEISDDDMDIEEVDSNTPKSKRRSASGVRYNEDQVEISDSEPEEIPAKLVEEDYELFQYPCTVCGNYENSATILTCDDCDSTYHMGCLTPPLLVIPEDDWFCPLCEHQMLIQTLKDKYKELRKILYAIDRKQNKITTKMFGINRDNIMEVSRSTRTRKEVDYDENKFDKIVKGAVKDVTPADEKKLSTNASAKSRKDDSDGSDEHLGSESETLDKDESDVIKPSTRSPTPTSALAHKSKKSSLESVKSPETEDTGSTEKSRSTRTRKEVNYDETKFDKMVKSAVKDLNTSNKKKSSTTSSVKSKKYDSDDTNKHLSSESELSDKVESGTKETNKARKVSGTSASTSKHKSKKSSLHNVKSPEIQDKGSTGQSRSTRTRKGVNYDESKFDKMVKRAVKDLYTTDKKKSSTASSSKSRMKDSDDSDNHSSEGELSDNPTVERKKQKSRKRSLRDVTSPELEEAQLTELTEDSETPGPTRNKTRKLTRHESDQEQSGKQNVEDKDNEKVEKLRGNRANDSTDGRKKRSDESEKKHHSKKKSRHDREVRKQRESKVDEHQDADSDFSLSDADKKMDTDGESGDSEHYEDEGIKHKQPEEHIYYTSSGRKTNSLSSLKNAF